MHSIYGNNGFKSGNRGPEVLGPVNAALSDLSEQGATVFVPGLTELPLLFDQLHFPASMMAINTAAVYARHALALTEAGRVGAGSR